MPRLEATVDADPADWTDKGFAVRSLPGRGGKLLPARQFDAGLRLGWNAQGLLILAEIQDSVLYDPPENEPITSGDSIELYVTPQRGSAQNYGVLIAAAADGPPRGPTSIVVLTRTGRHWTHRSPARQPATDTCWRSFCLGRIWD